MISWSQPYHFQVASGSSALTTTLGSSLRQTTNGHAALVENMKCEKIAAEHG
jgi:hypothetical protein